MKSRIILMVLVVMMTLSGCSGTGNIPGFTEIPPVQNHQTDSTFVSDFKSEAGAIGLLGAFSLSITDDLSGYELIPLRSISIGESYIINGRSFFNTFPCIDCLKLDSIGLDSDDNIVLKFTIRHPFKKGNSSQPPSGKNRLDLDIFDVALYFSPASIQPDPFPLTGVEAFTNILLSTDGYSRELEQILASDALLPYVICCKNEENNRFSMGTSSQFDVILKRNDSLEFTLYLTMAYGNSAVFANRLQPDYYIPEFNRKPPWKIILTPPEPPDTWLSSDNTTFHDIQIDIYDWNHGVEIASSYPDPDHKNHISTPSDVDSVTVEIPGMMAFAESAVTSDTSSNGWDDPVTYVASIANENLLPAGEYTGLVRVIDSREADDYTVSGVCYDWARTWYAENENDYTQCNDVVVDTQGNIYVTGFFRGTVDFDPGADEDLMTCVDFTNDVFLSKFDSFGNHIWTKIWGGWHYNKAWYTDAAESCAVDSLGNIYITGAFAFEVDFDPNPLIRIMISHGEDDVFLLRLTPDGEFAWIRTWGGEKFDRSYSVAVDSEDNVYVKGLFDGAFDFDPGFPVDGHIGDGIFLTKYTSNGTYTWTRSWKTDVFDNGRGIVFDDDNNICLAGNFNNTIDFDPGVGVYERTSDSMSEDAYLLKLDVDGTFLWAKTWGGTGDDLAYDLIPSAGQDIYVAGQFQQSVDFNPGAGVEMHQAGGNADAYVSKLNASGDFRWVKTWGGYSDDDIVSARAVGVSSNGEIYVTGNFTGSIDFNPGSRIDICDLSGAERAYLSSLTPEGSFLSYRVWDAPAYSISASESDDIYISGFFKTANADFYPGDNQDIHDGFGLKTAFLMKFKSCEILLNPPGGMLIDSPDGKNLNYLSDPYYATWQSFKAIVID
jgi:hypothetical protein